MGLACNTMSGVRGKQGSGILEFNVLVLWDKRHQSYPAATDLHPFMADNVHAWPILECGLTVGQLKGALVPGHRMGSLGTIEVAVKCVHNVYKEQYL